MPEAGNTIPTDQSWEPQIINMSVNPFNTQKVRQTNLIWTINISSEGLNDLDPCRKGD